MAYDLSKVVVTSSPHIKADDDTRSLMLDVLIALVPALAVAIYTFGVRALIHVIIAMVSCAVFETIYNKIVKHENTVGDLSCFVTGVLIAFNIPVAAPLWLTVFGGLFGIVIVKMLFGGIGKNFMNPALGARAFMMASWAGFMTTWTAPHAKLPATLPLPTRSPPRLRSQASRPALCRTFRSLNPCSARPAASSARPPRWR